MFSYETSVINLIVFDNSRELFLFLLSNLLCMKRIFLFSLIISACIIAACDAPQEPKNDTPVVKEDPNSVNIKTEMYPNCWFNEHTLQRTIVHSKPFASKMDSSWVDSYGLRCYLRDVVEGMPKSITIDFWALFVKNSFNAKVVVSIDSVDKSKFWVGGEIKDLVKTPDQWEQINYKLTLPPKLSPDDKITVYIMCPKENVLYIDDLTVKFGF